MSDWGNTQSSVDWNGGGGFGATSTGNTDQYIADSTAGATGGWEPTDGPGGEFEAAAGNDRACFNCGEEGHNKADCPNPRVMKCRHCNEEGHLVRECPTAPPQEFSGECRYCKKDGHMIKDCPEKPPMVCNNCQEEGHLAADCKGARKIDRSNVREVTAELAWVKIENGAQAKDLDIVKEGIQEYVKSEPTTTFVDLENAFRAQELDLYLIALENPSILLTHTNMDMQGNLDKKYRVQYRWTNKPLRPREAQQWPQSAEENLERLKDAGETVDRGLPVCVNCGELGHISKRCTQEKVEKDHIVIMCFNCDQPGHRIRDCPEPRKTKYACRNCGQGGHIATDCTEPRSAPDDLECRKCGGTGHFAKDCPQEEGGRSRACFNCGEEGHNSRDCPNPKKIQCRNCDEFGHVSKECPKPRDYSRVKCSKCGEMGHTQIRCKMEAAPLDETTFDQPSFDMTGGDNGDNGAHSSGDWKDEAPASAAAAGDEEQATGPWEAASDMEW